MFAYSSTSLQAIELNRVPLLAALAAFNVLEVTIDYEGSGDSGDVMEVNISPEEQATVLTVEKIPYHTVQAAYVEGSYQYQLAVMPLSIMEAVRDFALTWVNIHHGGWENNEGGSGAVTIHVAENRFELSHSEYYTERTDYDYAL